MSDDRRDPEERRRHEESRLREASGHYDAAGRLALEHKRNRFINSPAGGRTLSALMLPAFTLRPPAGFGVLSTTGRKTGKTRRRCIRTIRQGDRVYVVMIRPLVTAKASAWVLNIRADPRVRLRIRGGTFEGVARELTDSHDLAQARQAYCETILPFDYTECVFHRGQRPTRTRIKELHRSWFDTGIAFVVELGARR